MKGPCGHLIPFGRTSCPLLKCQPVARIMASRSTGKGPRSAKPANENRWQGKRCPFCLGLQGQFAGMGNCWLSACNRGPQGGNCGCHHMLTGMGRPSAKEQPHLDGRRRPDPRLFQWARTVA